VIAGLSRAGTAVAVAPGALETGVRAALGDAGARERMAARGPSIVDGYGAFRARDALLALLRDAPRLEPLVLRPARESDARLLLEWRNDPEARAASRTQEVVPLPDHQRWLGAVLADPDRTLLIAERAGKPVGTVRFDRRANEAEISVAVAPSARGGGLGRRLIAEASELELEARPQLDRIVAAVRRENRRSAGVFERAGFTLVASDDEADSLLTLVLHRRRPPTDRFDS
jgi:RimJ/RimL family protein N-acetyltransferase